MLHEIAMEIVDSPLGHRRILSWDPIFEKALQKVAGVVDKCRCSARLTRKQINAMVKLIDIYAITGKLEKAGCLYTMLATRKPSSRLDEPRLVNRIEILEKAERCFNGSRTHMTIESTKRHLLVQREVMNIVRDVYEAYEKDEEDTQVLMWLDVSIVPSSELRAMVECWLTGTDEETLAAFQRNQEYGASHSLSSFVFNSDWCRMWMICCGPSSDKSDDCMYSMTNADEM